MSLAISQAADKIASVEQYAVRGFADALDVIPLALAENSGLPPIETLAALKSAQISEKNSYLGVDCVGSGTNGMFLEPHSARILTSSFRHEETTCF